MLYYLFYTSVDICAVILILELKMHTKNRNVHVYTCTNFQEHLNRGREDVRVVETSDHKTQMHFPSFPHFSTDKTQKAARILKKLLCLLSKAALSIRTVGRTLNLSRSFS